MRYLWLKIHALILGIFALGFALGIVSAAPPDPSSLPEWNLTCEEARAELHEAIRFYHDYTVKVDEANASATFITKADMLRKQADLIDLGDEATGKVAIALSKANTACGYED